MSTKTDGKFDDNIKKALLLPEPKRSEKLRVIIKKQFIKEGLEPAMETAKLFSHKLTDAERQKIVEDIVLPE